MKERNSVIKFSKKRESSQVREMKQKRNEKKLISGLSIDRSIFDLKIFVCFRLFTDDDDDVK